MGAGVALKLVADGNDFRGVLLQSPFASYQDAVASVVGTGLSSWVIEGLVGNVFNNVENIEGEEEQPLSANTNNCQLTFCVS